MALSSFSLVAPSVFNGEGFHIWVVKMKTYLQAFDLWEVVNSDVELEPLKANPTVAQIRQHADERTKRGVSRDKLKEKTRQQQLLNLRRDFENLKMKEEETVNQYSDIIMVVVNSIRLLGEQFSEARIVEKSKEELADWRSTKKVPFEQKLNLPRALLPIKAKRLGEPSLSQILQEEGINPADIAKDLCKHCKKMGHVEKVCRSKSKPRQYQPQQPKAEARVAEEGSDQEEQVFTVSYTSSKEKAAKGWLIDSGCINHMSPDATIFKTIDRSFNTKLLEKGYSVVFKGKECQIDELKGSKLMSVTMAHKSFVVDWTNGSDTAYTPTSDESMLWHQRLDLVNYKSMDQLTRENLAENFIGSVEK
ncbi:uncharacterized protein LOC105801109 [Gossypium raimondii]|uniref:uncharacterized protein LOC105801109 n=1 Tax=Gossypium raimondii TaxID=29730 RepID=UPI00063ADD0D|nr:uncharacterized protein LOC105801109 [Gossypium raimondii]